MKKRMLFVLLIVAMCGACSNHKLAVRGEGVRTARVVAGPGTFGTKLDTGLIVEFQNEKKKLMMRADVISSPILFYDRFKHYRNGEQVVVQFMKDDIVAISGMLFQVLKIVTITEDPGKTSGLNSASKVSL